MNGDWDKLAEHYMGADAKRKDVVIAKLDAMNEKAIAMRYGVANFPSILFFKKGEMFPSDRYANMRTFENFRLWIEQQAGPEVVEAAIKEKIEIKETEVKEKIETRSTIENRTQEQNHVGREELKELKVMLSEINFKLDNKVETISADINFGQGLSFLLVGVFLGVGISFTIINYQRLGARKKLLD